MNTTTAPAAAHHVSVAPLSTDHEGQVATGAPAAALERKPIRHYGSQTDEPAAAQTHVNADERERIESSYGEGSSAQSTGESRQVGSKSTPAAATDSRVTLTKEIIEEFFDEILPRAIWPNEDGDIKEFRAIRTKRIRDAALAAIDLQIEVERLRMDSEILHKAGIIEIAVRNPVVSGWLTHWEDRAIKAEAEVEKWKASADYWSKAHNKALERAEAALKPVSERQIRDVCIAAQKGIPTYSGYIMEVSMEACREVLRLAGAKVVP